MQYLKDISNPNDVFAFLDSDYSDHPEEIVSLLAPIAAGEFEFVLGSRVLLPNS